jgi:tRNA nucleotidyltransferase (CCA-adding enzyme)
MASAFEQAALALTAVVTYAPVAQRARVELECSAPDPELLLAEWLNAVIYEMAVRNMLFARFDVTIADTRLWATLWGEHVDPRRHEPAAEPKGATYTALEVTHGKSGIWFAQCVIDV